jgi:crossover junction endodeoxyribonuclease RuvC
VFLEKVSAMKGQGVTSMFSFGTNYGTWLGIIAAFHFPYTLVTPQAWKKAMMEGMDKSNDDGDRQRALQLFPEMGVHLARKKDDGRADALLICEYGRRQL